MTTLSDNVAELLRRGGIQLSLAREVGVDQSSISRLAKGSDPKPQTLVAIARHAGVSVETLVEVPIAEWPQADREGFKHRRKSLGWSPAILAQETHAIVKRERANAPVTAHEVEAYEAGDGVQAPSWLRFAEMAFQEGGSAKHQDTSPRGELLYVRQVDIRYAMGDGSAIEDYPETTLVPFTATFLRNLTRSPVERLILATGHGDSMDPTVKEHDLVLIDAGEDRVGLGDNIWAFEYAGAGYLKRLRPVMRDGEKMYEVNSDNKVVAPTFYAHPSEIHIVGKLILLLRRKP